MAEVHHATLHCGFYQLCMQYSREKYWITGLRSKNMKIHENFCTIHTPFIHSTDYTGPFKLLNLTKIQGHATLRLRVITKGHLLTGHQVIKPLEPHPSHTVKSKNIALDKIRVIENDP